MFLNAPRIKVLRGKSNKSGFHGNLYDKAPLGLARGVGVGVALVRTLPQYFKEFDVDFPSYFRQHGIV